MFYFKPTDSVSEDDHFLIELYSFLQN